MEEIWRDVPEYVGLYQVSNRGRIKRLESQIIDSLGRRRTIPEKLRVPVCVHVYLYCAMYKENVEKREAVHRLVATAFIKNPEGKPCVNHINGVKSDNRVENHEWCTHSENNLHAFSTGLSRPYERKGSKNPMFGKHHNESAKRKIGLSHLGSRHSDETRRKMSLSQKGKKFTEEHKEKISLSLKRTKNSERRA